MADSRSRLLRSAGSMAFMTALSRVTGYVRDSIQAVILGAADSSDAFIIAYRIPNLLRRLVGEGAMTAAFVPVFTELDSRQGRAQVFHFAAAFFNALAVLLAALTAAGVLFAPGLVRAMAYGFVGIEGKEALTVHLTRLMFPYLFFIGLSALLMAILNALDSFALPAFTPVLLNLSIIACALGFARRLEEPADAFAWGVLIGGFLQLVVQMPALWRAGMRPWPRLELGNPDVRRVALLMFPGMFGAGIYQINLLIDSQFASFLAPGSVSYLFYANRVTELVLGIFIVSLSQVILPSLARDVQRDSGAGVRDTLDFGMRQTVFVTLPACAGLMALSEPIIGVLFERGRFDAAATTLTARALVFYAAGLLPVAALKVILPAFYARQDTRTPVWVALWTLLLHIALNFALIRWIPMGHAGLALSTSLSALFNWGALAWIHWRRWGPAWGPLSQRALLNCTLASLGMAVVCSYAMEWLGFHAKLGLLRALVLGSVIVLGMAIFLVILMALRAPEPAELVAAVRRRSGPTHGPLGGDPDRRGA